MQLVEENLAIEQYLTLAAFSKRIAKMYDILYPVTGMTDLLDRLKFAY